MADGKAEGAVSGVLVFMVEIALRAKAAPTPSIARWIDMEEFLVWRETGGLMLYSLKRSRAMPPVFWSG